MGVQLKDRTQDLLTVHNVREGQIVEVIYCKGNPTHQGKILQRYKDNQFIGISGGRIETYPHLFELSNPQDFLVRVLKNGEELIITENE